MRSTALLCSGNTSVATLVNQEMSDVTRSLAVLRPADRLN